MHCHCQLNGSVMHHHLKLYGITLNTITMEFMVVLEYLVCDLRQYLDKNFNKLTWKDKLKFILDIIYDLHNIHLTGFTHQALHGGNILMALRDEGIRPVISNYALMQNSNSGSSKGANIYGFGVIMTEVSHGTHRRRGGVPQRYVSLANQCMNADPSMRPSTSDIKSTLNYWYNIYLKRLENLTAEELQIKNEFEAADKIISIPANL